MKKTACLLSALITFPALAGDLWEVTSTSVGPDGKPMGYTQKHCFPKDGMDPSLLLSKLGSCTFDQENGDVSAMTFSMTCKTPGMPAELEPVKVSGEARLNGDRFDMRYAIAVGGNRGLPGGDFKMRGNAEARKIGQCDER